MSIEFRCHNCRAWNALSRITCRSCGYEFPRYGRVYRVEVRRPNGRKTRRSCGKRAGLEEARQLEHELKLRVAAEAETEPDEPTWGWVTRQYLKRLEIEDRYYPNAETHVRASLECWGDCPISHITPDTIRQWQLDLRKTRKPGTVDTYLQTCRAAWNSVLGHDGNPFRKVKFYNPDNRVTRWLKPEERARLLNAARAQSERWYQLIAISLATGLRQENVLQLRRDEIDWDQRMIRVTQKGGKSYVAPMAPGVAAILRSIPPNGTPYYWINEKTGKPFIQNWHTWNKIKKQAGIDSVFRWHDIRHDFGTSIYGTTRDLKLAKEALGHANIKTTERYAHLLPEHLREAIDAIDPIAHPPAHPVRKK